MRFFGEFTMDFSELAPARRTIRRFKQIPVPDSELRHIVDMARHSSCASNKQPIRYVIIRGKELVKAVFETTRWAGMVAPRRTPEWGKNAPLAFIALCVPADAGKFIDADAGAAIQSMEFAAWERGLGCCWFASFSPEKVQELINLDESKKVLYIVAVGFPDESPEGEDSVNGEVAYYLDDADTLHVPKLPTDEITTWL